jgi:hypothetical protein
MDLCNAIFWVSVAEDPSLCDEADRAEIPILSLAHEFGPWRDTNYV